jgi:hypothetical protein
MKHSSRCNDRSSVGAVELFLVNLNDDGTSERLVSRSELLEAMTMQLNTRLHQCAQNLQDQKLLAILSAGDVVAQELKYQLVSNCLSLDSYKLHRSASLNTTHPVLPRCASTT